MINFLIGLLIAVVCSLCLGVVLAVLAFAARFALGFICFGWYFACDVLDWLVG